MEDDAGSSGGAGGGGGPPPSVEAEWERTHLPRLMQFLGEFGRDAAGGASAGGAELTDDIGDGIWSKYEWRVLEMLRSEESALTLELPDLDRWGGGAGTETAAFMQAFFAHIWRELDGAAARFAQATALRYRAQQPAGAAAPLPPAAALGDVHVVVRMAAGGPTVSVRGIRCEQLNCLQRLRGTATRVSDVRPELRTAAFVCNVCNTLIPRVPQEFRFTAPARCPLRDCKNRHLWTAKTELSEFYDWQKIRLQENSSEIPAGSMPRALDVIVHRSLCDSVRPGDRVVFTGCLVAVPDVSALMKIGEVPRAIRAEKNRASRRADSGAGADSGVSGLKTLGVRALGHRLVFMAVDVGQVESDGRVDLAAAGGGAGMIADRPSDALERSMADLRVPPAEKTLFLATAAAEDTLARLAASFAPNICGHQHIKKGVLLMLAGGVAKRTGTEGLRLRGDINVCIVGDPGTAKSQLLKHVRGFAPRAVYTAGNTSSAAGLTVSVTRDADSGESVIEAGALMVADTGVCCIDEFEKMSVKDMVAIHEAVEQQTISVCKGGVHATLNARASLLAACNPRFSHYDPSRPFRHNVRLSAPIISRFDLFFTMLDTTDYDEAVARHIIEQHADPAAAAAAASGPLSEDQLKLYIKVARSRQPVLTAAARRMLAQAYVDLRNDAGAGGAGGGAGGGGSARVTVRSLESLVRLSEAAAKLKLEDRVTEAHVREALRVMRSSLVKLRRNKLTLVWEPPEDAAAAAAGKAAEGGLAGGSAGGDGGVGASVAPASAPAPAPASREFTMDVDLYETITAALISKFRSAETDVRASGGGLGGSFSEVLIPKDDLIGWYLENFLSEAAIGSEEGLRTEYQRLECVVNRMVRHDMSLVEELRTLDDGEQIATLRLHPNYSEDITGGVEEALLRKKPGAHAAADFFPAAGGGGGGDEADAGGAAAGGAAAGDAAGDDTAAADAAASWMLPDEDFMAQIYGWNAPTQNDQ